MVPPLTALSFADTTTRSSSHDADPDDGAAALHALLAVVVVHSEAGERAQFQEVAAAVEQSRDTLARQELATFLEPGMLRLGLGDDARLEGADLGEASRHPLRIGRGRRRRSDRAAK